VQCFAKLISYPLAERWRPNPEQIREVGEEAGHLIGNARAAGLQV
jgi:hypothetical protein